MRTDLTAVLRTWIAVITGVVGTGAMLWIGWVETEVRLRITDIQGCGVTILTVGIGLAALGVARDSGLAHRGFGIAEIDRTAVTVLAV